MGGGKEKMSRTFNLVCEECKKSAWVGQSIHLYKYDYIAEFLHEHIGHPLKFIEDDYLEEDIEECVSLQLEFIDKSELGTCKNL